MYTPLVHMQRTCADECTSVSQMCVRVSAVYVTLPCACQCRHVELEQSHSVSSSCVVT